MVVAAHLAARLSARLSRAYDELLTRHRLATTFVTGCVLGGLGDAVAQAGQSATGPAPREERKPEEEGYDLERGAAFGLFGGVLAGPHRKRALAPSDRARSGPGNLRRTEIPSRVWTLSLRRRAQ